MKRPGRSKKPERDNISHGQELEEKVSILRREFQQSTETTPPEFNPALIFRLKLDGIVSEDEWRRSGLTLLSDDHNGMVVLFSEDQLAEFQKRIGEYSQEVPDGMKAPHYAWIASVTNDIAAWGRSDRIGRKLTGVEIKPDETYSVDAELWHYGDKEECSKRMDELREFTRNNNSQFLDFYLGRSLSIARIKLSGDTLEKLLHVGIVKTIDLPPQPDFTVGDLLRVPLDEFPNPVPPPPEDALGICIIDSGVNRGHPMLGPAIGDTCAIPDNLGDGLDKHGHGTMVAGIALYGDVRSCIDGLDFNPKFFLYSARVTNDANYFDDEKLIVNQMREAIEHFHQRYKCRVFNISLGDENLVYNGGKLSSWSHILDTLARELDIVIIVSAGNLNILNMNGNEANNLLSSYPNYFKDEKARIIEPATAVNVITVGALAHTESPNLISRFPDDPAVRCIAGIDQPSPFTRRGPGINGSIKPEVCEYGGNSTWDGRSGRIINDHNVGIVSMNLRHLERLFKADIGTSFAAPKVAYLAGLILKDYPGISANLVRALIANGAVIPTALNGTLDEEETLNLCGYGQPASERVLFSTENRVTLLAEDNLALDALHLYQIPIPEEFKQATGKRRISVVLAFDPPVRHTRKDYLGIKMSFRLLRGLSTERIVEWYSERPRENNDPNNLTSAPEIDKKIPSRYKCDMDPLPSRREAGTLQKASFNFQQNRSVTNYEGDSFHLLVSCSKEWAQPTEFEGQRYAVTVTLEHLEEPIQLYNVIEQRVQIPQRVRVRQT